MFSRKETSGVDDTDSLSRMASAGSPYAAKKLRTMVLRYWVRAAGAMIEMI